ncbi:CoA ester lyase [Polynucleobacter sp. AP-Latsch-80-C2]|jgi:citrate lyase subunit beta/citryl-CoA lyase|uniref:HpcH/HpaI aldolase/citrate lyase family protein n=1 Tax=Polynucleobacter sp. AP-Latsch-80-C2 TaxID=2576931 RepID=UPI001C0D7ECF|nr:CoA ester lyase [Polynucleobacter sp. AP-Latsch-80-C2]MBU3623467.1 CoA ester lyase [Polynucleobacter sp. AP-Latsch-80-C2]
MNPLEKSLTSLAFSSNFLFVPGTRPERFSKALDSGATAVVLDLEDAVPEENKEDARNAIRSAWPNFTDEQKQRLVIRTNAPGSRFYSADLILAQELNVPCILIPKSELADEVNGAALILPNTAIIPMIETALGLDHLREIANSNQVIRLALGNLDLQADLGMVCDQDETELQTARYQIVLASRLAKIAPPIDGVTPSTDDSARISNDAQRAKRMGFGAKLCIHPKQVSIVKAAFMPTDDELAWAHRVIEADQNSNGGAVKLDGRMIDRPVVLLAQRTIALAGKY